MSVAIRTVTRVQDQDDFSGTPGAGTDGFGVVWHSDVGEFALLPVSVMLFDVVLASLTVPTGFVLIYPNMSVPDGVTVTVAGKLIDQDQP